MKKPMKHYQLYIIAIVLIVLTLACNMPGSVPSGSQQPSPVAVSQLTNLITPDPNATVTPTPFMPIDPTLTVLPTFPATTPDPDLPTDAPTNESYMGRYPRPDGQVNILLLGSDFRPMSGFRTDVIMLVSLNPKKNTASVISFPRDLYVMIPGWQMQRINTAQQHGGFATTVATFEYNFGVTPDHYVMTNFDGFKGIIDTLGGIDINSSKGLSDKCDLPQSVNHYCSIGVGTYHMDGATALWYVRSRYSTSDFDRTRRAQEVIQGVFVKMLSLNAIARAPELYNLFKSSVETDLTLADILPLLPLANKLSDTSQVQRYAVTPEYVTSWTTETGAAVLLPNQDLIWNDIIKKAVYGQ